MSNIYWRGFVKDQFNLEAKPKDFLRITSNNVKEDLITGANSTFNCLEISDSVAEGDVLMVMDQHAKHWYSGVIKSVDADELTITTSQMIEIFSGEWIYSLPTFIGIGNDSSWYFEKYQQLDVEEYKYPQPSDLDKLTPLSTATYLDSATSISMGIGDTYTAKATLYVLSSKRQVVSLVCTTDDNGSLTINDKKIGDTSSATAKTFDECIFKKGWNKIEIVYTETTGSDGWLLTYNGSHIISSGLFEAITSTATSNVSLEEKIVEALKDFSSGKMRDSSYIDPLIATKLGSLNISAESETIGNFTTQSDNYTMDMAQFLYDLYDNYRIMLDFDINYEGTNSVVVKKINEEAEIKLADNIYQIVDVSPTTEVVETNRMIVYDSNGLYRTTYVTKADGTRAEEPSSIVNRFGVVNTTIVFSDDDIEDLLEANLPTEMYNHKLTFTLKRAGNIFSFDDFKLGMPLKIWRGSEYFQTVITGREYSKEEGEDVKEITYTCGNVRTKLTDKLLKRLGVSS